MFAWVAANKIMFTIGLFAAVVALCAGSYYVGLAKGKDVQAAAQATAERNAVVEGRTVERAIMILPKNEVQKRLEIKWCRDCS